MSYLIPCKAVRLVKYCTGAEILTLGLHTQGSNHGDFVKNLNLLSCWEDLNFDKISDFACSGKLKKKL